MIVPNRRIALFVPELVGGGAERTMVHLAAGLASADYQVDLVMLRAKGPYLSMVPTTVRVVELGSRRLRGSVLALARYLRRERPKAMLSPFVQANIVALLARRISRTDTRIIVREANYVSMNASNAKLPLIRLAYRLAPLLYRWADALVAVSNAVADDLAQTSGLQRERISVIYNAGVTPRLLRDAKREIDHPWFDPSAPPVVLGIGRLEKQKDFQTLIRAFATVRRVRAARLMILGEGQEAHHLRELISALELSDHVSLEGFVSNPYTYVVRAAVVVSSSAWEGCSNVILEAMALGTPVVATDCPGGTREIVGDGAYGHLVPVGNSEAMAAAVLDVLLGAGKQVDPQWLRNFDLDAMLNQYQALLEHPSERCSLDRCDDGSRR